MAHVSSKHVEVESMQTAGTKRQGTTTQTQVLCTCVSPELELFHSQPAQSTGKETGFFPPLPPHRHVPLPASVRTETVQSP